MGKKILYISWQGAMGHVPRDLAIAQEIRTQIPEAEISWMAPPLAGRLIEEAGEKLLPESARSADYNLAGLKVSRGFQFNLLKYVLRVRKKYGQNIRLFKEVIKKYPFDFVIGDESYELINGWMDIRPARPPHFFMIHDFIGLMPASGSLLEQTLIWLRNWKFWLKTYPRIPPEELTHLFVGEIDDVLDRSFGLILPNRRDWAKKWCQFLGYIVRFDPAEYADKAAIRKRLGYGSEPLIICATGGTCIGQELLELCGLAYPILKQKMPNLRMVMICGEGYGRKPPQIPVGLELHRYIPRLYEHFAASDLAIVVGGGTSTLELTALRKRFLYFPLKGQFDQQFFISDRLERHKAGIKMDYDKTSPERLAEVVLANIGKEATWPGIPTQGAKKAAQLVSQFP